MTFKEPASSITAPFRPGTTPGLRPPSPPVRRPFPVSVPCRAVHVHASARGHTATCVTAAQAPYAGNAQLQQLALASLTNLGCYVQGGGVLTPPAYGTVGDASRNLFRGPNYYNVDFSVSKIWKFKERYSAQFRAEFFNLFNRADFPIPGVANPSAAQADSSVVLVPHRTRLTPCSVRVVRAIYSSA